MAAQDKASGSDVLLAVTIYFYLDTNKRRQEWRAAHSHLDLMIGNATQLSERLPALHMIHVCPVWTASKKKTL